MARRSIERVGALVATVLAVGCARHEPAPVAPTPVPVEPTAAAHPAAPTPAPPPTPADPEGRRWIPGDLHSHVAPPDGVHDVELDVAGVAKLARANGLEFVGLAPHLWPDHWRDAHERAHWLADWAHMAEGAAAEKGITMIPGVEWGVPNVGHFGVYGVDLRTLAGKHDGDLLAAAADAGAFLVVNHPFAVPTRIPGVEASHWDLSYRPWTHGGADAVVFSAVEVLNIPLSLGNLVSRPGGATGMERAFRTADRRVRDQHRRLVTVGGSDNHHKLLPITTWVLAKDTSVPTLLAALRAGAVCVGPTAEAGTLRAHGDRDAEGAWARIGDTVHAERTVELRWDGDGELFVDGVSQGVRPGTFTHALPAGDAVPHTYRLAIGQSRSGFVYANLP